MKLYYSATSPFVRKVMILLNETGALDQVEQIAGSGTTLEPNPETVAVNPLGKVPALVLADGQVLYDSTVICRYLAARYQPDLYPEGDRLFPTLVLEATANGMMEAAYLMVCETRLRPREVQFEPWIEGHWAKIARALDMLEAQVHGDAMNGPLTMGQFALAAALGYLDLRFSDRGWRNGHAKLAAWEEMMAQRPSIKATTPVA